MSTFVPFQLIEAFGNRDFERLPESLRFDRHIKEEGKLYRLLLGTVNIQNTVTGEVFRQRTNYSILGTSTSTRFSYTLFRNPLSGGATIDNIDNYLSRSNPANIPLFRDLIYEFCSYFYYRSKNMHTISFLHIYRILEKMSFTFPLLYASRATDYTGAFSKLSSYFKTGNSELNFFNMFISDFFEQIFLDYRVKFSITAQNDDIKEIYFKLLKKLCVNSSPNITIVDSNEFSDITIANKDTINLLIHIRNRYFHFAAGGQRNIPSNEMIEANDFYEFLNDQFANWLSVIYFKIVKNSIDIYS